LKIDGIFYLDEHLKPVLTKGYHRSQLAEITFSFYDFEKHTNNLKLLPTPTTEHGAPKKFGFINTRHGPAMFSTTQIRDSDMGGQDRGFLIMVQLLEKEFVEGLSNNTLTDITYQPIPTEKMLSTLRNWNEKSHNVKVKPYSDMLLRDVADRAITVLRLEHSIGGVPRLINEQSMIFVVLMSLFIYLVYRLVSMTIIKPVKKLAADIKERDSSRRYCPLDNHYEVSELATVSQNVNDLILIVQQQKDELSKQANTDPLTRILNRRGLMSAMEVHKERCIRNNIGFVVVMADIDYFKLYNDSLGHLEGDVALVEVASVLNQQCQRNRDVCARYGGEEFTLLFGDMNNEDLYKKLNNIIKVMEEFALPHPSSVTAKHITLSFGAVVIKPNDAVDFTLSINEILREADGALYEAKHQGRNCFVVKSFSDEGNTAEILPLLFKKS
jgi:diguanylate cyclase (GGDEF)-like protein